jgi:hypothetical protein
MLKLEPISEQAHFMRQIMIMKVNEIFQLLGNYEASTELLWAEMQLKTAGQWIDTVVINGKLKNAPVPAPAPASADNQSDVASHEPKDSSDNEPNPTV